VELEGVVKEVDDGLGLGGLGGGGVWLLLSGWAAKKNDKMVSA